MEKYPPKKVYIKKRNKFIPLSYDEFLRRKDQTHLYTVKKFLPVRGFLVEVNEDIYTAFYQCKEHEEYVEKIDKQLGVLSINAFDNEDSFDSDYFVTESNSVEDIVNKNILIERLYISLQSLSYEERNLIKSLYFDDLTEREIAKLHGLSQVAIHKRKKKILSKLKKFLEKF